MVDRINNMNHIEPYEKLMATTKNTKAFYKTAIPSDWEVKELGDLTSLCTNGFVGKAKESYDETGDGVLYIQGYNVTEGGFNLKGIKKVTQAFHKKNNKSNLKDSDLLTIQTGDIGVTTIVPKELEGSNCHALIISRFNLEVAFPLFYCHFFNSGMGRRILKTIETGSTLKHLNVGDMVNIKLPLPPLPEQKAIAQVLSTADAAIQTTEKLIAQKELLKKWLMQQLLTGKKRLKGFDGDWKEYQLKKLCKISKGEQLNKIELHKTGKYPSYSGGITPSGYTDDWNTSENTIIISEGGNSCGYVNFITTKFWCGGHCYALLDLFNSINLSFLYQILKYHEPQIMKLRVGSGLPNIQKKDIENFTVYLPFFKEQIAIARVLQAADTEISLLKAKAEKLREQKKGLMQVLLTGKKRLL